LKKIEVLLSREEIMQLSLSVVARLGILQTRWASGVKDESENKMLLGLMNELQHLASRLDLELKKLDGEVEDGCENE
jgi:hypothetical protein